jgi:predicted MFS family arabinose efflux permease
MGESVGVKEATGTRPRGAADGAEGTQPGLSRGTVWVLAVASGLTVANLYYNQPLLREMGRSVGTSGGRAGLFSALAQVGYALGLLLFVPLGDIRERRGLILALLAAVTVALVAVAVAPGAIWLAAASLALGATTVTPQVIVPLAAGLAPPGERGRVVGTVMSGLLIGILLSRTVSGFVGFYLGWRAMFWIAAALMAALAVTLRLLLPPSHARARLSYGQVLRSLPGLFREPVLRQSCLFGAAGFAAFSAFWTTLAFFLDGPPYHLGSDAAGLFGLAGVAGALAAPVSGRVADRRSPRLAIGGGLAVMLLAFAVFWLFGTSLWGLIAGVILLDLGAQSSHIANQARVYGLPAEAHNRLNTAYMVCFFVGGSAGSALATWAWGLAGWPGACGVGAAALLAGLGAFVVTRPRQ